MEGAGLTPYLERLPDAGRQPFIEAYERKVAQAFHRLPGGELLVSFPRLFLIAAT